jgi:uncharacterized repeat protein (TIGR01451 family)
MTGFPMRLREFVRSAAIAVALAGSVLLPFGAPAAWAQEADLSMSKSAPGSAAANTDITYTLTASNLGPDDAVTVTVTDPLPAGLTFVSHVAPAGWICGTPAPGSGGTVTCTTASLLAGGSAVITLVAHIPPATPPGTFFTNVATITSPTDPNSENDTGVATTLVSGGTSADLSISKSGPATVGPNP